MTIQRENPNEERKFRGELIEHIPKAQREVFYKEMRRVIRKEGILVV